MPDVVGEAWPDVTQGATPVDVSYVFARTDHDGIAFHMTLPLLGSQQETEPPPPERPIERARKVIRRAWAS